MCIDHARESIVHSCYCVFVFGTECQQWPPRNDARAAQRHRRAWMPTSVCCVRSTSIACACALPRALALLQEFIIRLDPMPCPMFDECNESYIFFFGYDRTQNMSLPARRYGYVSNTRTKFIAVVRDVHVKEGEIKTVRRRSMFRIVLCPLDFISAFFLMRR